MSVAYTDNIGLGRSLPLDNRYGPYKSTRLKTAKQVALDSVPLEVRHAGLTIGIVDDSTQQVSDYWWPKANDLNQDPQLKSSGVSSIKGTEISSSPLIRNIIVTDDTADSSIKIINIGENVQTVANRADSISVTNAITDSTKYPSITAVKNYINNNVLNIFNDRGGYDPTVSPNINLFPSSGGTGSGGTPKKGDIWFITKAGNIKDIAVVVGSSVRALIDSPGQTEENWARLDIGTGYVPENIQYKVQSTSDAIYNTVVGDDDLKKRYYPSIGTVKSMITSLGGVPTLNDVLGIAGTGTGAPVAGEGINRNITLTTGSSATDNYILLQKTDATEKNTIKRSSIKLEYTSSDYIEYGNQKINYTKGTNSDTLDFSSGISASSSGVIRTFKFRSDLTSGNYQIATISDLSNYLTSAAASTTYQPLNPENLSKISSFSDTAKGVLKKTGAATWSLDTNNYLTDQNIASNSGIVWNYDATRPSGAVSLANKFSIMYNTTIATTNSARKSVVIGGLTTPTSASELAKLTIIELLDKILFATADPNITEPSSVLSVTNLNTPTSTPNLIKVGTSMTPTIKATFDPGSADPTGDTFAAASAGDRSGASWKYEFTGPGGFAVIKPSNPLITVPVTSPQSATYTSPFIATIGNMTFTSTVSYAAGKKTWKSDGTEYDTKAQGSIPNSRVIEGVYPIWATLYVNGSAAEITNEVELSTLYSMTTNLTIEITLAEENATTKQRFYIPTAWVKPFTKIEVWNTATNSYEQTNGSSQAWLDKGPSDNGYTAPFTQSSRYIKLATPVTKTINGSSVTYTQYQWNGITKGQQKIRLTFSS